MTHRYTYPGRLLQLAFTILAWLLFPLGVHAQTFPCDGKMYYFGSGGANGTLVSVDNYTSGTNPTTTVVCNMPTSAHNALGGNPMDGYLYFSGQGNQLTRLDASCNATMVCAGIISGISVNGGFDTWGRYWFVSPSGLEAWDITTCTRVKGPIVVPAGAYLDIAFNMADCNLYLANASNATIFDTSGNSLGTVSAQFLGGGPYGGATFGIDGNLYGLGNAMTRVDMIANTSTQLTVTEAVYVGGGRDFGSFPCSKVNANFTNNASTGGCGGGGSLTVQFNDASSPVPNYWEWNFGDPASGANNTSSLQNPSHTFSAPGTYSVTLTAKIYKGNCALGATNDTIIPVTVSVGGATMTLTSSSTPTTCGASNGTATVTVASGGTPNYSYTWVPSVSTAASAVALSSGIYTVTVTDAASCTATATINVSTSGGIDSVKFIAPANVKNVTCFNKNDGSATASVYGGTAPYTYAWSPAGGTAISATSLTASTSGTSYTVTVTDNATCTKTATVTITQPSDIMLTTSKEDVLCNGQSTGTATVTATGGTPAYTYAWTGTASVASTATALSATSYTVTVTDLNGCTKTTTVTITEPSAISTSMTTVAANCGVSDGSASVSASGGTGTFSYTWAPNVSTTASAINLSGGTYTVTVMDANNCTKTVVGVVLSSGSVVTTITGFTDVSCAGLSDGTATASASGGNAPYTYQWMPGNLTGAAVTGLSAGTYTVTGFDKDNCSDTTTVTISEPAAIVLTTSKTDANCGNADGSATVNASGGAGGFSYAWTPGVSTNNTAVNISAGTYDIIVTDANSCTNDTTITILNTGAATIALDSIVDVKCAGNATGAIYITATGGVPTLTYSWSSGQITDDLTGLTLGFYTVTVTGGNGCTATLGMEVTEPSPLTVTGSHTDANCGAANGSATVTPAGGISPYTYTWTPNVSSTNAATNIGAASYAIRITDANACTKDTSITVSNIGGATITVDSSVAVKCYGGNTGAIYVTVTGGVSPYGYNWMPGSKTTEDITGLTAGSYMLTVTAANSCQTIQTVTVSEPAALVLTTSKTNTSCGRNNGSATVTANGGTTPFTYLWSGSGSTAATVSTLLAGPYTVTVTDGNSCPKTATVLLTDAPGPDAIFTSSNACVNTSIAFTDKSTIPGGSPITGWAWDFGDGTTSASQTTSHAYPTAQNYNVRLVVTDANGCQDSVTNTVTVYPLPLVDFTGGMGCSPLTVTFANNSTKGAGTSYEWNFGTVPASTSKDSVPVKTFTAAGTYTVTLTVISANNCSLSLSKPAVTVYPVPDAAFTADPAETEILAPKITFYDQSLNAASWLWHFGDGDSSILTSPTHAYREPGTYSVSLKVTSADGCIDIIYGTVVVKPEFEFYIPNAFTPDGDGNNDYFKGYGIGIVEYKMYIYDRWGNITFEGDHIDKYWDGKVMGGNKGIVPEDTYVYLVVLTDIFGKKHRYVGGVTVIK